MLCQFARQFPNVVADFLNRSRSLHRRFREESVTDLLMANLIAIGGNRVYVEFPNEPVTGADMEWNFVNWDDNSFYRLRIQAKRLYGIGRNWKRYSYMHLTDLSPNKQQLQVEVLCNSARSNTRVSSLHLLQCPRSLRSCLERRFLGASRCKYC
jgi:hypothetical protein